MPSLVGSEMCIRDSSLQYSNMEPLLQGNKDITSEIPQDKQAYLKTIKQTLETLKKEVELTPENGWKQSYDKKNVKGHKKEIKDSLPSIRSEGVINFPAQTVIDLISDLNRRGQYDEIFDSGKVLEDIHKQLKIIYIKNKGKLLVSGRDFVQLSYSEVANGVYYSVSQSIDYPQVPPAKGLVRADLRYGCWMIKPLTKDSCNVVFSVNIDIKGSVPDALKNHVLNLQTEKVGIIREYLEKANKK
eukprot:TRINITY_DN3524_c0_g1_i1.p1 TRINITY_DN3524_c0_g1~~TRINITY_DN3524_c0_g1_i1.p1  ORF type:complete len:244 (-),score=52.29 TRINITY_DN3524_c0_g1_i1:161-892(-)